MQRAFISVISFDPEDVPWTDTEDQKLPFLSWAHVTLGKSLNCPELQVSSADTVVPALALSQKNCWDDMMKNHMDLKSPA